MKFSKIYIEITNYCNLNCSFCSKDSRKKQEMSISNFKNIIKEIKPYTNSIYLHVKGEPLLHSKIDEILTICDENNLNVRITTNGTLLKNKKEILSKHKIKQINISLHSENSFVNYFDDVFNTSDKLSKKTTIIYRIWTLQNLKLNEISTNIVNKLKKHYNLSTEIVDKIINEKNIKIDNNIYLDKDFEFKWPILSKLNEVKGTCLGTRSHIAILVNGDVVPCCLDSNGEIKLGNIFEKSLTEILNDKLFQSIKIGFQNNKVIAPLCKNCSFRKRFEKKQVCSF